MWDNVEDALGICNCDVMKCEKMTEHENVLKKFINDSKKYQQKKEYGKNENDERWGLIEIRKMSANMIKNIVKEKPNKNKKGLWIYYIVNQLREGIEDNGNSLFALFDTKENREKQTFPVLLNIIIKKIGYDEIESKNIKKAFMCNFRNSISHLDYGFKVCENINEWKVVWRERKKDLQNEEWGWSKLELEYCKMLKTTEILKAEWGWFGPKIQDHSQAPLSA